MSVCSEQPGSPNLWFDYIFLMTRFPRRRFNYVLGRLLFHFVLFSWKLGTNLPIHLVWSSSIWPQLSFKHPFVTSFILKLWFSDPRVCQNHLDSLFNSGSVDLGEDLSIYLHVYQFPRWRWCCWSRDQSLECRYSENTWIWHSVFQCLHFLVRIHFSFSAYFEVKFMFIVSVALLLLIFSSNHIQAPIINSFILIILLWGS